MSNVPPPRSKETEILAIRTLSALAKMPAEDRESVLNEVPHTVGGAAELVATNIRGSAPELEPRVDVLEQRIEQAIVENDDASRLDDTYKSGAETKQTLIDVTAEPEWLVAVQRGKQALAAAFGAAGASREELERLVIQLELLQDLGGRRELSQVNDRLVRETLAQLKDVDLADLVKNAGKELGLTLFAALERTAKSEDAI